MKKIFYILILTSIISAQDAAGQYKLSGLDILYTYITRAENTLTVTDAYGLGVTIPVATILAAVPFTTQAMQFTDAALGGFWGFNINVALYEDGSGAITEGSFYPDVNTITDENGSCVTIYQVLPVRDEFTYTSMGNMMEYVGMAHPGLNVLGLPGISSMAGQQVGGFSLSSSLTIENFPMFPAHPTLCDSSGTDCFPFTVGDIDGSGTLEIYPDVNLLGIPEYVPGGAPLTGLTAGYFLKRGLNTDDITSVFPGNTEPDFILEWHGVDGADSDLGWGDDRDLDEDGDGTWFDRIVGIPGITATYMNPACGFNMPIYGDVSAVFEAMGMGFCVDYVDAAASAYLMDAALATWGNFMTANAAQFNGCLAATGGDAAFCAGTYPQWLADDSDHDFNGVDGRLTMNFDIPCVGIIEAREVVAEFIEVGGGDCGTGDMNADGGLNVLDVVALVNQVLGGGSDSCIGDMNADDGLDILDITMLIKNIIGGDECNDPDSVDITISNSSQNDYILSIDSVCVKGLQISLLGNFTFEVNDGVTVVSSISEGVTLVLIFNLTGECIPYEISMNSDTNSNESFEILDIIAAGCRSHIPVTFIDSLELKIENSNIPSDYYIGTPYPNPFNPTSTISFSIPEFGFTTITAYDITGKELEILTNTSLNPGNYNIDWNASSYPSGVYLIRMESGEFIQTQKVVLVK